MSDVEDPVPVQAEPVIEPAEEEKPQPTQMPSVSKKLVIYRSGDFAYGDLDADNRRHGFIRYQCARGPHMMGNFEKNEREGQFRVDFDRETVYVGGYHTDIKDGVGVYRMENEVLVGQFGRGHLNGYGRYFAEKSYYEGFFADSKMDGYGIEIMANSDCYIGEFKRGRKEGLGFYLYNKGGYYYGFFKNGEKHEMGVQYNSNYDCYYIGEFNTDMRNGRGMQMYDFVNLDPKMGRFLTDSLKMTRDMVQE